MSVSWGQMKDDVKNAQGFCTALINAQSAMSNPNLTGQQAETELQAISTFTSDSSYSKLLSNTPDTQNFCDQLTTAAETVLSQNTLTSTTPLGLKWGYGGTAGYNATSAQGSVNVANNSLNTTISFSTASFDNWDGAVTVGSVSGFNNSDMSQLQSDIKTTLNSGQTTSFVNSEGIQVTIQQAPGVGSGSAYVTFTGTIAAFGLVAPAITSVQTALTNILKLYNI